MQSRQHHSAIRHELATVLPAIISFDDGNFPWKISTTRVNCKHRDRRNYSCWLHRVKPAMKTADEKAKLSARTLFSSRLSSQYRHSVQGQKLCCALLLLLAFDCSIIHTPFLTIFLSHDCWWLTSNVIKLRSAFSDRPRSFLDRLDSLNEEIHKIMITKRLEATAWRKQSQVFSRTSAYLNRLRNNPQNS